MPFHPPTVDDLAHRYDYHAPKGDQVGRYTEIRHAIKQAAIACVRLTPCSPEQTRALNALDEAMFLFNAAIARTSSVQCEKCEVKNGSQDPGLQF